MEALIAALLADLNDSIDRLADELEVERPPCGAERPLLYRALDEGALDARRFDRLMTIEARRSRSGGR